MCFQCIFNGINWEPFAFYLQPNEFQDDVDNDGLFFFTTLCNRNNNRRSSRTGTTQGIFYKANEGESERRRALLCMIFFVCMSDSSQRMCTQSESIQIRTTIHICTHTRWRTGKRRVPFRLEYTFESMHIAAYIYTSFHSFVCLFDSCYLFNFAKITRCACPFPGASNKS